MQWYLIHPPPPPKYLRRDPQGLANWFAYVDSQIREKLAKSLGPVHDPFFLDGLDVTTPLSEIMKWDRERRRAPNLPPSI